MQSKLLKNVFVQWKALLLTAIVFIASIFSARSFDREIGGYVDRAEDRFVRNVWNFIKNFQSWQTIGGNRWQEVQYYYGEPFEFNTNHLDYVDKMDLSYVAAHGAAYYVQTNQSTSDGIDLRTCPGYGDLAHGSGDLEFLIIESCSTVASAPEASDWWTQWSTLFHGLHQLNGFRTLSYSDNGIPNRYANKLKANGGVMQSWFSAVDGERTFNGDGTYTSFPGFASSVLYTTTENDRLGAYGAADPYGTVNMITVWQY